MKDLLDLHTHTIVSGHAYSTLQENVTGAKNAGLKIMGTSEHAPAMKGTCTAVYFHNFRVIPSTIDQVRVLRGVELNILNPQGDVDLTEKDMAQLDYALASLHLNCMAPHSKEENTLAYINCMKNPMVKIIGHPDDGRYEFDVEQIVKAAKEHHVLLEINNSSLKPNAFRVNSRSILTEMVKYCKEYQVPLIMGSDAHISFDVGNHQYAEEFLISQDFPTELIVNYNESLIHEYFPMV